jgi:hypothetical protein
LKHLLYAALVCVLASSLLAGGALARNTIKNNWLAAYPDACQDLKDAANSCTLCHPSGTFDLNPYADDLNSNGLDFSAIADLDSDGDTVPNGAEIEACTLPGNPSSRVAADGDTWGSIKTLYR